MTPVPIRSSKSIPILMRFPREFLFPCVQEEPRKRTVTWDDVIVTYYGMKLATSNGKCKASVWCSSVRLSVCPLGHILKVAHQGRTPTQPAYVSVLWPECRPICLFIAQFRRRYAYDEMHISCALQYQITRVCWCMFGNVWLSPGWADNCDTQTQVFEQILCYT